MGLFQVRLDAAAFEELVSRLLRPALAAAGEVLSDASLAEDAVQEALLRVVRCRGSYSPSRPFSPWFYRILRNVCTDMLRGRARRAELVRGVALRLASGGGRGRDSGDGEALLSGLPEAARAVLSLRIVHGLAFRDVAAALGISEEAAKKRAQRALRRLREDRAAEARAEGLWVGRAGAGASAGRVSGGFVEEGVPNRGSQAYCGMDSGETQGADGLSRGT